MFFLQDGGTAHVKIHNVFRSTDQGICHKLIHDVFVSFRTTQLIFDDFQHAMPARDLSNFALYSSDQLLIG